MVPRYLAELKASTLMMNIFGCGAVNIACLTGGKRPWVNYMSFVLYFNLTFAQAQGRLWAFCPIGHFCCISLSICVCRKKFRLLCDSYSGYTRQAKLYFINWRLYSGMKNAQVLSTTIRLSVCMKSNWAESKCCISATSIFVPATKIRIFCFASDVKFTGHIKFDVSLCLKIF